MRTYQIGGIFKFIWLLQFNRVYIKCDCAQDHIKHRSYKEQDQMFCYVSTSNFTRLLARRQRWTPKPNLSRCLVLEPATDTSSWQQFVNHTVVLALARLTCRFPQRNHGSAWTVFLGPGKTDTRPLQPFVPLVRPTFTLSNWRNNSTGPPRAGPLLTAIHCLFSLSFSAPKPLLCKSSPALPME